MLDLNSYGFIPLLRAMGPAEQIENLEENPEPELDFDQEHLVQQLSDAARKLVDRTSWIKNITIENRGEERKRFKEAHRKGKKFRPEFEFSEFPHREVDLLRVLDQCIEASGRISQEHLDRYGAETLKPGEMQRFFQEIFTELKLYTRLGANIEDEDSWKKCSREIWPLPGEEVLQESIERLEELDPVEEQKTVDAEQLAEMFREELEGLGIDYSVEVRDVKGCFNIPEERTLVTARGRDEERMYSEKEARMLTIHETFHVVRAHNGFKAGRNGFPDLIGVHTPFYTTTEEGGALYRERKTGAAFERQDFDYHLRLVAAYRIAQSDDYRGEFQDIVEELIELGGSVDRSFYLVARNRKALRHHIYQNGYREWQDYEGERWPLLMGKLNPEWAEKFAEEAETGGMFRKPDIGPEELFEERWPG